MSSSSAGKFQDHYLVLGVDPKSDTPAIQRAYAELKEKYHPDNRETGDPVKYEAIGLAFEVLSDPALRRGFDEMKGVGHEKGNPKFSGLSFFDALGREAVVRIAVLCVLYDRRRVKPSTPALAMRHLEDLLEITNEELLSALWYLKQRHYVISDDKSSLQVTVEGVDFLAQSRPVPEVVMPLIKSAMLAPPSPKTVPAKITIPTPAREREPVLAVLNRALSRG